MLKVHRREIGTVTELILGDADENVITGSDVFVEDGKLVVVDNESKTTVFTHKLPGPVEVTRNVEGKLIEWQDDGNIIFYEMAFNPVVEIDGVVRAAQTIALKPDNMKHAMMQMARVQLLAEEVSKDRDLISHTDWVVRIYRTFCHCLLAGEKPVAGKTGTDDDGNEVYIPGHNGLVGCIAHHCLGMIAGHNE